MVNIMIITIIIMIIQDRNWFLYDIPDMEKNYIVKYINIKFTEKILEEAK